MKGRSLYELLRADGSIIINKNLARAIGINEAIIYSELLSRYFYFEGRNNLGLDGYFYNTVDDLEIGTTLTRWTQEPAIKKLVKLGLIKTKVSGVPPKRHFKIVDDADILLDLLNKGRAMQGKSIKYMLSSDNLPDIIREGCQVLADGFKGIGAENNITPDRVFEILAAEMAKP